MNKKRALYFIIPFLSIIFGIGIINFVVKDNKVSEAENRALRQRPTIENIKDKTFTKEYDTYYTDQFVLRDKLIKLDTVMQLQSNKSRVKGLYITDDGYILDVPATTKATNEDYKENVEDINNIAIKAKDRNKEFCYISLPRKENALTHKYPRYVDKNYGLENSKLFLSMLNQKSINTIDVGSYFINKFSPEEIEKMYFKTDHHWNSIGAHKAFKYIIDGLNKKYDLNVDLSDYKYKTKVVKEKEFLGSYNINLYELFDKNERIPYVYMDRRYNNKYYDLNNKEINEDKIIASDKNKNEITYGGGYTNDYPYYKVVNKNAITDKKILIIKDSFEAPLTWLFSDVFEEVEIVDLRHIDLSIDEILDKSKSDIVTVMFNNGLDLNSMLENI